MAAMLVHAAANSAQGTQPDTHVVVLAASDEQALQALSNELTLSAIPHVAFHEPDVPYCGQLMAVGICPLGERRMVRRFLRGFSLVR